ncbi:MAG: hypothetical protein HY226_05745 [Candidatus Vogelbacteria bacterium]|nr:hypothetical protein [Candidatus Vogelbacteria bacterium]
MFERLKNGLREEVGYRIVLTVIAGVMIVLGILHFRKPCGMLGATSSTDPSVLGAQSFEALLVEPRRLSSATQGVPKTTASIVRSGITTKVEMPPKISSVTHSVLSTFQRNPMYENNPLFDLYEKIILGVSDDQYFVRGVRNINMELKGTTDKAFIKYEGGNVAPGLRFIHPKKEIEMRFAIYLGNSIWQELAVPGAEIHVVLKSSPCEDTSVATVREAQYLYFDCVGVKHQYPLKVK